MNRIIKRKMNNIKKYCQSKLLKNEVYLKYLTPNYRQTLY